MGDSRQAMGARQAESSARPLVGKSKRYRRRTMMATNAAVRTGQPQHVFGLVEVAVDRGVHLLAVARASGRPMPASGRLSDVTALPVTAIVPSLP